MLDAAFRQGRKKECPTSNFSEFQSITNKKMLPFVLKTADKKLKLSYHFINLMSNVFKLEAVTSNDASCWGRVNVRSICPEFTGHISDFKRCSMRYFQVGDGKNHFIRSDKQKCFNFIIVLVGVNASSASECYDWPGVDVLRQRVLNSYVLIPVIFLLRSHTAEFRQFTGNAATSRTGKLPERIYWYFWKGQFTGNSQEKSVCVKRLVVSSVCWPWFVVRLDIYSQTLQKGLLSFCVTHYESSTINRTPLTSCVDLFPITTENWGGAYQRAYYFFKEQ